MIRITTLLATALRRRSELRPLLRALWLLPLTTKRIRRLGHRVVSDRSMLQPDSPAASGWQLARAQRLSRVVQLASRHGVNEGTCLSRSLVLLDLMQRESLPGVLRIGVRMHGTSPAQFEAHAWVECNSLALNDRADADGAFAAFERSGSPADGPASASVA